MVAKSDLHVHSKFSGLSTEWVFRRFGFPASCTEPEELYQLLKKRGMDFVTITDDDSIEGCLRIADREDVFLSEKVTTYFPGDRCRLQILVWGLSEEQHEEIVQKRSDIFALRDYLLTEELAHAVAHPLYAVNDQLTTAHIEKLLLLFNHFEGVNGLRDALFSESFTYLIEKLDEEKLIELSEKHGIAIEPRIRAQKILIGGSDDHGGIFPGSAWTEVRKARTPAEFLEQVKLGGCTPGGRAGTPLALSHSLYNIGFNYLKTKLHNQRDGGTLQLLEKAFSRFMEGKDPTEFSFGDKIGFLAQGIVTGKIFELVKPGQASLWKELSKYLDDTDFRASVADQTKAIIEPERRAFVMANLIANQLFYRFFKKFVREISGGGLIESVQAVSVMVPVLALLTPYIYAFQSQAPNQVRLRKIVEETVGSAPEVLSREKRCWVTDTLEDVNGVSTTIQRMCEEAVAAGADLTVLTSMSQVHDHGIPLKNFNPIGEFELPEYELQKLSFPPVLQIIDYIQKERFSEVIISTPGPTGLVALLAAKMLGLKTSGIYHTDFPQYVRILTDDNFLETLTWNYMHWFYGQMDLVYVNSEPYRESWVQRGIPGERLEILPRGLDTRLFTPEQRDVNFWRERGLLEGEVGLLYVGRVSREKDLEVLVEVNKFLSTRKQPARLLIVGDGPYRSAMKEAVPNAIFTGYLEGKDLAKAYASGDIFVFPSTTDTFGNVILEALASGLPCIVSDQGGPAQLVEEGRTGFITPALNAKKFADAVEKLVKNQELRQKMSIAARAAVQDRNWENAFRKFWGSCSKENAEAKNLSTLD